MNKQLVKKKLPYIGAIISLIPALFISLDESPITISILIAFALIVNIWALKSPAIIIDAAINFVNSAVMFAFAIDYYLMEKKAIQYAYFIAAIFFLIAAIRMAYKNHNQKITKDSK